MSRNRSIRKTCVLLGTLVAAVSLAPAEEILHFTNGMTMAIRSHVIDEGMIHVDLGGNALMAFPASQVERITDAGRDVYLPPSYAPANVAAAGDARGARVKVHVAAVSSGGPVFGRETAGGSSSRRRPGGPNDDVDALLNAALGLRAAQQRAGTGTAAAFPDSANPALRKMRVAGRTDAYRGSAAQTGLVGDLGRTLSGEAKLITPEMAKKLGNAGEIKRFRPSDAAAAAAVAEGKPLNLPPPPPPATGEGAGDSGSSGDSGQ